MPKYILALGRIPSISVAELHAVLPADTKYLQRFHNWLVIELAEELSEPQQFLDRLGGSTKLIRVEAENLATRDLPSHLSELAAARFATREDKVRYAISIYNVNNNPEKILKTCLLETKKKLKSAGLSSRFINNNFHNPPTAQLAGERILQKGAEFCALEIDKKWLIGHTEAIQNINAYSERDYERPDRDPKQGMLPPKLAQILINISGSKAGDSIYDPFCGIGTVLMEGLLMGINVIGSDLNEANIQKTRNNLAWLATKYTSPQTSRNSASPAAGKTRLFCKDATKVTKSDLHEKISAVVTETFLGPPVSHLPSDSQMELNTAKVEHLIFGFLENIRPLLTPDARVAMTVLCYKSGPHFVHLDHLFRELEHLGYEQAEILPPDLLNQLNLPEDSQYSLIYDRPDQTVAREIIVLKTI